MRVEGVSMCANRYSSAPRGVWSWLPYTRVTRHIAPRLVNFQIGAPSGAYNDRRDAAQAAWSQIWVKCMFLVFGINYKKNPTNQRKKHLEIPWVSRDVPQIVCEIKDLSKITVLVTNIKIFLQFEHEEGLKKIYK